MDGPFSIRKILPTSSPEGKASGAGFVCMAVLSSDSSDVPILSPTEDWEKCDKNPTGLTPNVVFVEGKHVPQETKLMSMSLTRFFSSGWKQIGPDSFLVWYQGCDSRIGLFHLKVHL